MSTYNTNDEILDAINEYGKISGIVYIYWFSLIGSDIDDINNLLSNQLVGDKYGDLLEDIEYELKGCDTEDGSLIIKMYADADNLLDEITEKTYSSTGSPIEIEPDNEINILSCWGG
jgi:hypothetical protein